MTNDVISTDSRTRPPSTTYSRAVLPKTTVWNAFAHGQQRDYIIIAAKALSLHLKERVTFELDHDCFSMDIYLLLLCCMH